MKKFFLISFITVLAVFSCKSTAELPVPSESEHTATENTADEDSPQRDSTAAPEATPAAPSAEATVPVEAAPVAEAPLAPETVPAAPSAEAPVPVEAAPVAEAPLAPETVPETASAPDVPVEPTAAAPSESESVAQSESAATAPEAPPAAPAAPSAAPAAPSAEATVPVEAAPVAEAPLAPETVPETAAAPSESESVAQPESAGVPSESAATAPEATPAAPAAPSAEATVPVPSRSVALGLRQYLDVQYPGSGWIYLGELEPDGTDKKVPLLTYFGRQLNRTDTVFALRSGKSGESVLHFYKPDVLTGAYIDDYLAVTVADQPTADTSRVKAPAYADIVPPDQYTIPVPVPAENAGTDTSVLSEGVPDKSVSPDGTDSPAAGFAPTGTSAVPQAGTGLSEAASDTEFSTVIVQPDRSSASQSASSSDAAPAAVSEVVAANESLAATPSSAEESIDAGDLLEQAQSAYDAGEYEKAASLLDTFFASAGTDIDRALFLQGNVYEAQSDITNIRKSIAAYTQLVQTYPQSSLWQQAKNRATYLNRFYFSIR